ncbi:hypothetical protein GmHk_14G040911 [Glycine max]|nr:hypothetical protein GmHk_14G040911 [Glycine max]
MSLKWRQFKYELKSKGYDESKIKEEMVAHIPDPRVDPSQYRDLVYYWCSEKRQDELKKKMIEAESSQNLQSTQDSTNWKNDIYLKVKGHEKRGRVRCLGKLPHQASSSQSSYANNRIQKLENLLENLVVVLKVHFAEDPQINQVLEAIDQEEHGLDGEDVRML